MNIRDEEQLQQYFERQMTGSQEQNFLINVAARDDMRLAFRSQLELLKAVREDKDASGSPTFIRTKTLGALGLGGALMPSSLKEQETKALAASSSVWQNIGATFKRPLVSVSAGLLVGILGTSILMPASETHDRGTSSGAVISVPATQTPKVAVPSALAQPAKDQLGNKAAHSTVSSANHQRITQKNIPVTDSRKPGEIDVKNNIHKPDDPVK